MTRESKSLFDAFCIVLEQHAQVVVSDACALTQRSIGKSRSTQTHNVELGTTSFAFFH